MIFNDFTKQIKIKTHLTGINEIEDYKLNFARMFFLNRFTQFTKSSCTSQTGRSTHNTLLALYNCVHKNESSLIIVFTTEDKERTLRDLESFTRQLKISENIIHPYSGIHNRINILPLNAWRNQKTELRKKYNHVFIDNDIIDQYHKFLLEKVDDNGHNFFIKLCNEFSLVVQKIKRSKSFKSINCLNLISDSEIIDSCNESFKIGDIFTITANNNNASGIGTLININYNESISWASTIDILFDNDIIQMPIHNIEYFTKL